MATRSNSDVRPLVHPAVRSYRAATFFPETRTHSGRASTRGGPFFVILFRSSSRAAGASSTWGSRLFQHALGTHGTPVANANAVRFIGSQHELRASWCHSASKRETTPSLAALGISIAQADPALICLFSHHGEAASFNALCNNFPVSYSCFS